MFAKSGDHPPAAPRPRAHTALTAFTFTVRVSSECGPGAVSVGSEHSYHGVEFQLLYFLLSVTLGLVSVRLRVRAPGKGAA